MTIRLLLLGEGKQAAELASACQGAAQWPADDYEGLAGESGGGSFCLIAEESPGEVAGLLAARTVTQEAEVLNLAVAPAHRRRGLASELLAEALCLLAAAGARKVWLEVRESNLPAIAFYQRHGFAVLGRRHAYYHSPPEDALLLARKVPAPQVEPATGAGPRAS